MKRQYMKKTLKKSEIEIRKKLEMGKGERKQ